MGWSNGCSAKGAKKVRGFERAIFSALPRVRFQILLT